MKANGFRSALFASAAIAAGFALASVSPRYRTPGIIGGMGPAATCDLMAKVIAMTDAADDQHHIHTLVDLNTDVPDRTAAILGNGADPMPQLIASAKRLEASGADFLCMSCNTAHYFHERLSKHVSIPILNMPQESARELKRRGVRKVGLLATDGTIKTGVYHKFLKAEGVEVVVPSPENQKTVMHLIYGCVKKNVPVAEYPRDAVAKAVEDLKAQGAEAYLLACTELPIAFEALGYRDGFVDPTAVLAKAIIREAGAPLKAERLPAGPKVPSLTYKVDLDRPGGIYRCGETATFRVTLLSTNSLAGAKTPCALLDNFGTTVLTNVSFDVATTGVAFTVSGTLREPGFLRLSLPPTKSERSDPFVFSAGFEPEKIVKGSPSPADFDEFWAEARARLAREVPLDPQIVRVPERSSADFDFYRVSFATFGRRVYGYMSVPTDRSKAPFPVDFGVNAAGFGGWTNDMKGEKDSIRVQFSVYPFPPDWKWEESGLEASYKAMDAELAAKYGSPRYCQVGITVSREEYFFYPVILGIDRAVDWVAARPDVDRSRFRYEGTSQGGGFGFYLCGLNRAFTRAAFYVPAITDTMGYLRGRESGWPKIVENNSSTPERRAAAERWAPYFDGANFASRIECPVRVAVGFSDTSCPPCAVYAAYNEIKARDKAIGNGVGMTHSCFGRFYSEFGRWVKSSP